MEQSLIIFIVSMISVLISRVEGLICYQCNSFNDPGCELINPLENSTAYPQYLKVCDGDYHGYVPFCRKVKQTIIDKELSVRIIRSCGWIEDGLAKPCYKYDIGFHMEDICVCTTDACNAAPQSIRASVVSLLVATTVALLLR